MYKNPDFTISWILQKNANLTRKKKYNRKQKINELTEDFKMLKFKNGEKYFCKFIGDSNLKLICEVVSRTEKRITFKANNEIKTAKIFVELDHEYFLPFGKYSFQPIIRSTKKV
jgi:hypothetical protein